MRGIHGLQGKSAHLETELGEDYFATTAPASLLWYRDAAHNLGT